MAEINDPPNDNRPIFFVFFAIIIITSTVVLVNLTLDLKRRGKTHLVLLLGLSLYDLLGAVDFMFWLSVHYLPVRALCETSAFFARLYVMATATFVTMLSLEHFLSLTAPFWYDLHVSAKTARVASVVVSLCLLLLDGISFSGNSLAETLVVADNSTLTTCEILPASAISVAMSAVMLTNVILTLVFNTTVIRKLLQLQRASRALGGNNANNDHSEETALLRLVLGLSIVSVTSNFPLTVFAIWRLVDKEAAEPYKVMLTASGTLGNALNPMIFLICNANYRRRVRDWVKRALCVCKRQGPGEHNRVHPEAVAEAIRLEAPAPVAQG